MIIPHYHVIKNKKSVVIKLPNRKKVYINLNKYPCFEKSLKHQLSRKEKKPRKKVTQDGYEDAFEIVFDGKDKDKSNAHNNISKQENKNDGEISA